ncbi:MAG TPA: glycoside hydrolase family 43 protein [Kofleriaceae bacterium]|nr:glycoside hydrolase family 43 protein [Kofleriaceae bacterium]
MVVVLLVLGCSGSVSGSGSDPASASAPRYTNPVLDENCPDPGVLAHGGAFWAVCTSGSAPDTFPLRRSDDLVHWRLVGHIFPDGKIPAWSKGDFWAPEIHAIGDGFVVYFSARATTGQLSIGVATAPAIEGPWTDHGLPLVQDVKVGMIDPHQFQDTDGTRYLVWKGDGNAFQPPEPTPLYLQPLAADGLSLTGERTTIIRNDPTSWEGNVLEGGSILLHDGTYYLIYSGNVFNSDRYAVGVARAKKLTGPYEKRARPILVSDAAFVGPGHGSVVRAGDADHYVYHAWRAGRIDSAWDRPEFPRVMLLDPIHWVDGWPIIGDGTPSSEPQPPPALNRTGR